MKKLVYCELCASFIKPPTSRRVTAGRCKTFEEIKGKLTAREEKIEYNVRGNCPFLHCTRRFCERFIEK